MSTIVRRTIPKVQKNTLGKLPSQMITKTAPKPPDRRIEESLANFMNATAENRITAQKASEAANILQEVPRQKRRETEAAKRKELKEWKEKEARDKADKDEAVMALAMLVNSNLTPQGIPKLTYCVHQKRKTGNLAPHIKTKTIYCLDSTCSKCRRPKFGFVNKNNYSLTYCPHDHEKTGNLKPKLSTKAQYYLRSTCASCRRAKSTCLTAQKTGGGI